LKISALPKPIVPLSIVAWVEIATVEPLFKAFVFEPATVLTIVAKIFNLCPWKLAPKSTVSVLPVGEPPNVKIESPSWLFPPKFNTSPTAPVPPAPVVITVAVKSSLAKEANVSFVPAVIVTSPFDDNVPVKFLLTLKLVSVASLFAVVFKVLIVTWGKSNIEILFSGFVSFALLTVNTEAVVTSLPPTLAVNSNSVWDTIYLTIPDTVPFALFVNETVSPIFKSVVKFVPLPNTVASLFATVTLPVIVVFDPYVLVVSASAVYVGEPAIPICLTEFISLVLTPLNPKVSAWIVPVAEEVAPDITSLALNVPETFDSTTTVWEAVGLPDCAVTFNDVVPSLSNNSKVFVVVFLTTQTLAPELTVLFTEYVPPVRVICWPSLNPWEDKVATEGLAAVIAIAADLVAVTLWTVPVAPEVAPDTTSPVENEADVVKFRWVNISISNK